MASSGSYNFAVTRDDLISAAHQYIGATGEGETPTASQVTEAALILNMVMKLRATDGMPLWALKRGTILPTTGTSSITSVSHVVTYYDAKYLASAAAASASTIVVNSIGTIAASDQIGVELDDGSMHWTTVNGAPSGTTVTLTTALASAAAVSNRVYAYTASADRIQRPLRILEPKIFDPINLTGHPITQIDRQAFYDYGDLSAEGIPNQIYHDVSLGSNVADPTSSSTWYTTFYFYPRFIDGNNVIEFTYHRPFQDLDSASEHPDFPQEFYLPLMLELASLLGPKFGVPIEERAALRAEAQVYREEALMTIVPETSVFLQPESK